MTIRRVIQRIQSVSGESHHRYKMLSVKGKATLWIIALFNISILVAVIVITPTRIGGWFNAFAVRLRSMGPWGMLLCGMLVILSSHPPLFGFAGSMTLIGFTYGIWPGFLLASISSMLGAGLAFISVRSFFLEWVRKRSNDKWDAFGRVMANKGLPLVIMIRYCPLPWAMGNGLFASIESVKLWHFMLANLCMQPRLLIPVFIGSRLISLTQETPAHDPLRFWLNLGSILLSSSISIGTGIWIYRLTLDQMRKLDGNAPDEGELLAEALEEGALLGDFSDEGDDEPLTDRRLRPDAGLLRRVSSSGESA